MSLTLQIILIVMSAVVTFYALRKIKKSQLDIDDAFYWIIFSAVLLVMSIFPGIPSTLSRLIGIESPSNFVFLFMIFVITVKLFANSIELSVQKHRLNNLIQKLALINYEAEKKGAKSAGGDESSEEKSTRE